MVRVWREMRYAGRVFSRRPVLAFGCVLSLAFSIGANTAIVGIADQVLFAPLSLPESARLVSLYHVDNRSAQYQALSYGDYLAYRDSNRVLEELAAYARLPVDLTFDGDVERVSSEVVSGNYGEVLKFSPILGRSLQPEDDKRGAAPVALISATLWRTRFQQNPSALGRGLTINGDTFTIVGVVPDSYRGILLDWGGPPSVWLCLNQLHTVLGDQIASRMLSVQGSAWLMAVGRLQRGVELASAQASLSAVSQHVERTALDRADRPGVMLFSADRTRFWPAYRGAVQARIGLLLAGSLLALALACVNVGTLLLERGLERGREMAVRLALGATHADIIRMVLAECMLLAGAGMLGAVVIAIAGLTILAQFPLSLGVPLALDASVSVRVFAACFAIATVAALLCSVLPIVHLLRGTIANSLRSGSRAGTESRRAAWVRDGLVAFQISLTVVMLLAAGAVVDSILRASRLDLGFQSEGLLVAELNFPQKRYTTQAALDTADAVLKRLRASGIAESVSLGQMPPLTPIRSRMLASTHAESREEAMNVDASAVSDEYFSTLALPVIAGRGIEADDQRGEARVAVVNRMLARHLWGDESPIGKSIWLSRTPQQPTVPHIVVGMVTNAKYDTLWEERPYVYVPLHTAGIPPRAILIRGQETPATFAAAIGRTLHELDPQLARPVFHTWRESLRASLVQQRVIIGIFGALGAVMLLLATLGLYSVMLARLQRRTREIGVRLALGAAPQAIRRTVVRRAVIVTFIGLSLGTAPGIGLTGIMQQVMPGLRGTQLVTIVVVYVLLLLVGYLASLHPARRAASIDPARTLVQE
jgi:predicted permease